MSAESQFNEFQSVITKALKGSGIGEYLFVDGLVKSLTELYELLKHKELVDGLKETATKDVINAHEWVPVVAKIDYMAATERDIRMKMRNRVQSMRVRNDGGASKADSQEISMGFAANSVNEFAAAMTRIQSTA